MLVSALIRVPRPAEATAAAVHVVAPIFQVLLHDGALSGV